MSEGDDFAAFLSLEARSSTAALHEFRLLYSPTTPSIHLFIEGDEDLLYYMPEVRKRAANRPVYPHVCGGKHGVIEARQLIAEEGESEAICLYLIDRDYDDLFGVQAAPDENTFLTDSYSIENELVSEGALSVLLIDFARLSPADPKLTRAIERFHTGRGNFRRRIEPYLAWAIALRASGGKPNFNNANLKKIVAVAAEGKVSKVKGGTRHFGKAVLGPDVKVDGKAIRDWLATLRKLPSHQAVRGKYELWFFESFVLATVAADKLKVPPAVRERRLFDALGGRLAIPDPLAQFLDQRLAA